VAGDVDFRFRIQDSSLKIQDAHHKHFHEITSCDLKTSHSRVVTTRSVHIRNQATA
jgi:hypothetical protein